MEDEQENMKSKNFLYMKTAKCINCSVANGTWTAKRRENITFCDHENIKLLRKDGNAIGCMQHLMCLQIGMWA